MSLYFLVRVDNCELSSVQTKDEIQSNLESINASACVAALPNLDKDLQTLLVSTQDDTDTIECACALANFTSELMQAIGIDEVEVNENGITNLDRFNCLPKL